jgi:hypothetical protein
VLYSVAGTHQPKSDKDPAGPPKPR